jgi:hypothetical protein
MEVQGQWALMNKFQNRKTGSFTRDIRLSGNDTGVTGCAKMRYGSLPPFNSSRGYLTTYYSTGKHSGYPMLRTSYFAKSAREPGAVSISRFPPEWYTGARYFSLAPAPAMLKIEDWELFRQRYRDEVLSTLNPDAVLRELEKIVPGGAIIMLCFEKERSHCHRSLVAEWFLETKGIRVPEVGEESTTQITF